MPSAQSSTKRNSRVGVPSPQSTTSSSASSIFRIERRDDVRRLQVEVVARPVEVDRQQRDRVQAVLLAIGLRAHEQRLLRDAVRRVRLLGIAVPEILLAERRRRVLRDTSRSSPASTSFATPASRLCSSTCVPMTRFACQKSPGAARLAPIPPASCRQVEHDLGLGVAEEPRGVVLVREVVVGSCAGRRPRGPPASSRSTRWEPRKPLPPVTSALIRPWRRATACSSRHARPTCRGCRRTTRSSAARRPPRRRAAASRSRARASRTRP